MFGTDDFPPRRRELSHRRRRRPLLSAPVWLATGAVVSCLALAGIVLAIMVTAHSPQTAASSCQGARCHHTGSPTVDVTPTLTRTSRPDPKRPATRRNATTQPAPTPTSSFSPSPTPKPTSSSPRPKPTSPHHTPKPTPTPSRTPTPTPTPTPKSDVTVSYSLVGHWEDDEFKGQFTITNNGSKPVKGWELRVKLPHDEINAVWKAHFHMDGNTVVIDPPSSQATIEPGASLTENLTAEGPTTSPTSCTFNGSPC